ncbi:MAG: hypothetical protein MJ215_00805 [Spirochaetia bacterium]|nr:hypothetical protein [Spirochaetia bacterium]
MQTRIIRFYIFILFFLISASSAFSEDTISEINITGLSRTKPQAIMELLEKFKGLPAENFDTSQVVNELQQTGLFSQTDVSADGSALNITVAEKLSLLPIPFAYASSDSFGAGMMLMDNNAFGIMDQAGIGGLIANDKWRAMVSYSHSQKGDAPFGWHIGASSGTGKTKLRNEKRDSIITFDNTMVNASTGINRKLLPWLKASLETGFNMCYVDDSEPSSAMAVPVSVSLSARNAIWDGTFLDETFLTAKVTYNFSFWGNDFYELSVRGLWEKHLVQRLRLIADAGALYAPDVPAVFARNQNAMFISLLNSNYRISSAAGAGAGLEWGITNASFGTPSIYAQYQICQADGVLSDDILAHGPVLGFKFYLKKIAFPAIDIFAAYNVQTGLLRTSAGAGFSM